MDPTRIQFVPSLYPNHMKTNDLFFVYTFIFVSFHLCSNFFFRRGVIIFIRTHTFDNDNENACRITVHLHKRTLYIPIHPTQTLGLRSPDELHKLHHTSHTNTRKTDNRTHSKAQRKIII